VASLFAKHALPHAAQHTLATLGGVALHPRTCLAHYGLGALFKHWMLKVVPLAPTTTTATTTVANNTTTTTATTTATTTNTSAAPKRAKMLRHETSSSIVEEKAAPGTHPLLQPRP
jgi:hypothetical protein